VATEQIMQVPLAQLVPFRGVNGTGQARQHFDAAGLEELAQSMREAGFIEPILCRPIGPDQWEIIGGHRRCKAAALAGLAEVSAVVKPMTDDEALLNREEFCPWELGSGFADLLDSGLTIAEVAGRAGKSPAFVKSRIAIHTGAGEKARAFYLRKDITLAALEFVAALPCRPMAPVQCPRCKVVAAEGSQSCPACAADLSGVWTCDSGNPQEVAVGFLRGKTNGAVKEIVERVRESYGLGERPVQTSMGFTTQQISEAAIQVRTELERRLEEVSKAGDYFQKNAEKLQEYTTDQREAVVAQCEAAVKWLQYIQQAAAPASPALTMAL
jgi:ParB/RepB/Spo0J family partition protein